MPEETEGITPVEETPAAEVAQETTPEDVVPRSQYVGLQKKLSQRDRELQEARAGQVTLEHLKARDKRLFEALELVLPEDDEIEERPVSRRERLRQLRDAEPASHTEQTPELDPNEVKAWSKCEDVLEDLDIPVKSQRFETIVRKKAEELGYEPEPSELLPILRQMKKEADKKAALEELRLEQAKKDKESGATGGDTGPSAASLDLEELRRQYNLNPNDPKIAKEWEERRDEFYAMRRKKPK